MPGAIFLYILAWITAQKMAKQFTLRKKERLKSRKLIEQLFQEGVTFSIPPYRVFYLLEKKPVDGKTSTTTKGASIQFGVGVSGKNFKKAVDRNRIKRLTREAYRLQKPGLQESLMQKKLLLNIFFVYNNKDIPEFTLVKEKVNVILNKLLKVADENNSSNT